jgi:hypothetical protein
MIDEALRKRVVAFLQPLYQDLDGVSRFEEVERVAVIARRLYTPAQSESRAFELLLLFHGTGKWIDKIGNRSRAGLVTGLSDDELRALAGSIRRLDEPVSDAERALASAIVIDSAGVRGLASRLSRARREGSSIMDVVRDALADVIVPEWMTSQGRKWLTARYEARRKVCARILGEMALEDLG